MLSPAKYPDGLPGYAESPGIKKGSSRFPGEDGLDFYRELAKEAANHLKEGGFLAVEYGIGQTQPILDMLKDSGSFEDFEVIKDYGGIERAIYCRKKF